ncbi:hypothetical protein IM774_06860 [Erysipelotrichaceae bacterium RD49]|nr:hypothetical protein [Erysipelotrichaceae bacterium RD49]
MRRLNPKSEPVSQKEITLTEKHLFRESDPEYRELDTLTFVLKTLSGQKIHSSASMRKLVLIERANGYLKETRIRQFLPTQITL